MVAKPKKNYKQFSSKWAKKVYSSRGDKSQTMKKAGCGPTAAAIVIAEFCDASVTPWDVAQWFMAKGFRRDGSGTLWGAFKWVATKFKGKGIRKFATGGKGAIAATIKALDAGALVIANMGPGYWTKGGHYIVLWKCDGQYMYACDPGSSTRSKQSLANFKKEVKRFAAFWPQEAR